MLTVIIKRPLKDCDIQWATSDTTLEALNKLADTINQRRAPINLRTLTTGFQIVDDKPEKSARIVITPEHPLRAEKGGEVAVRFLGETEYYTFDQIVAMFKGEERNDDE